MELSKEEQEVLDGLLRQWRRHPKVQEMKQYIQHGAISTYDHVERVTQMCFMVNRRWMKGGLCGARSCTIFICMTGM